MTPDVKRLREIAEAQDAYGKWNTAPAWNRYYEAHRASQTPLRRFLGDLGSYAMLAAGFAITLSPFWIPMVRALL